MGGKLREARKREEWRGGSGGEGRSPSANPANGLDDTDDDDRCRPVPLVSRYQETWHKSNHKRYHHMRFLSSKCTKCICGRGNPGSH